MMAKEIRSDHIIRSIAEGKCERVGTDSEQSVAQRFAQVARQAIKHRSINLHSPATQVLLNYMGEITCRTANVEKAEAGLSCAVCHF